MADRTMIQAHANYSQWSTTRFAFAVTLLATSVSAFSGVGTRPLFNNGPALGSLSNRALGQQSRIAVGPRLGQSSNGLTGLKASLTAEGRAAGRSILARLKLSEVEQLFSKVSISHSLIHSRGYRCRVLQGFSDPLILYVLLLAMKKRGADFSVVFCSSMLMEMASWIPKVLERP